MSIDYTLVRGHRAPSRAARIGRILGAIVLVLATLAIGQLIAAHTPDATAQERPFVRTGAIGSVIDARTFDVKVLGVRGGALLTDGTSTYDTSGVWVIVDVQLTALGNPAMLGYAALLDGDARTYRATERFDQPLLTGRELQPGLPVTGEIAFEVPVSVTGDLTIQLSPATDGVLATDAVAQIRLPIDRASVDQWRTAKKPVVLANPKAVS